MKTEKGATKKDYFFHIIISEIVCVSVIFLSVFICKLFFKGEFKEFFEYYEKYATQKTRVEEVMDDI